MNDILFALRQSIFITDLLWVMQITLVLVLIGVIFVSIKIRRIWIEIRNADLARLSGIWDTGTDRMERLEYEVQQLKNK